MKNNSFLKAVSTVMTLTLIGKVLGLVKQIIMATVVGTSQEADLFFASYSFVSGISTAIFSATSVVLVNGYNKQKTKEEKSTIFSGVLFYSILAGIGCSLIIFFASTPISFLLAPGFSKENIEILSSLIQWLSPIAVLCSIQYPLTGVLDSRKKFIPGKSLAFILNLLLIIAALFFVGDYGITPLIIAVLLAFLLQIVLSLIFLKREDAHVTKINFLKDKRVKRLVFLALPVILGNAIAEINTIVDKSIASDIGVGSISAITYAASINEIVTILIINTIISVFYSYASSMASEGKIDETRVYTEKVTTTLTFALVPISIIVFVCAPSIVSLLYERGSFGTESVNITSNVIMGYAIGFLPVMLNSILTKIYYVFDNTKKPMISGAIAIVSNIILSIVLSRTIGIMGISLATSISNIISIVVLLLPSKQQVGKKYVKYLIGPKKEIAIAAVLAIATGSLLGAIIHLDRVLDIVVKSAAVIIVFFGTLAMLKINVVKEVKALVAKKT